MEKNKIDQSNLRQVILDFPKQFEEGFDLAKNIRVPGEFKSVCVSGMGGSSLPVDILNAYLKNKPLKILKNRNYKLPQEAFDNCLNIFSSYSGGTEEVLTALNEAIEKKLPSVGLAHGGKLIEVCKVNNIPFVIIPEISQPRYATGYFMAIMLQILANHRFIENNFSEILGSIEQLNVATKNIEEDGKSLAEKIYNKTPIIHVSEKLKAVGRIWKIKVNENAKTPCFYNYYPELNHNEMVGYTLPQAKFHIISLMDNKEHPQIIKRMKIMPALLKKYGVETTSIGIPDNSNLFLAIFSTLALADWMSYYLALKYKIDPTPVDMVEDFKKLLA